MPHFWVHFSVEIPDFDGLLCHTDPDRMASFGGHLVCKYGGGGRGQNCFHQRVVVEFGVFGAPQFSVQRSQNACFKGFWDLWTENRGASKTPSTATDPTPSRPSDFTKDPKIRNARLVIILFVRNFWRVCSQFWLFVRNFGCLFAILFEVLDLTEIQAEIPHLLVGRGGSLKGTKMANNTFVNKRAFPTKKRLKKKISLRGS